MMEKFIIGTIMLFYYINTSEITGELSSVGMIPSYVKITLVFTEVIRSPLLCLHNPLKST